METTVLKNTVTPNLNLKTYISFVGYLISKSHDNSGVFPLGSHISMPDFSIYNETKTGLIPYFSPMVEKDGVRLHGFSADHPMHIRFDAVAITRGKLIFFTLPLFCCDCSLLIYCVFRIFGTY